tara:strand:+ start:768 stop:1553 length:786 start_codon:yes stop_codon:yes gene_type:complete
MAIITLTTDLGHNDSYLASVKATIYTQLDDVKIVDISNSIEPFNIQEAAFILRNCYKDFPLGTIHIISIDDELTLNKEHLVIESDGHYFIGSDNGLFSLLFNEVLPQKIFRLNISLTTNCMTFSAKNIFAPAACHLARGGTMEIIGMPINNFVTNKMDLTAVIEADMIRGSVIYIDSYGNAITNIKRKEFEYLKRDRSFRIIFGREDEMITEISEKYSDVPNAEKLAIFGENNQLQIAMNRGFANKLLGFKIYEIIRVEFK